MVINRVLRVFVEIMVCLVNICQHFRSSTSDTSTLYILPPDIGVLEAME